MRVIIDFEEVIYRSVVVNCTDLQVARELWHFGPKHIRESWIADSVVDNSGIDMDSTSFTAKEG